MTRLSATTRKILPGFLVVVLLGLLPCWAEAAGISFHNDTQTPILIQGASVVNGMVRRGQPILLYPNRTAYDSNLPSGIRYITITDANQPRNVLLRDQVSFNGLDLSYSIRKVGQIHQLVAE